MSRERVLVTGGAGFIGSHLVDRLLSSGSEVIVIDDLSSGNMENIRRHVGKGRFRLVKGSICNRSVMHQNLSGVDTVIHLAAISSVSRSLAAPRLVDRVNVGGTVTLLDEARRRDVRTFVLASSAAVYGSRHSPPLGEELVPAPDSPYGVSKLSGESYCGAFHRSYGLGTVALRYFNVYGPRSARGEYGAVMMRFFERLARGLPLEIFGDGEQTRDFVHVEDVVSATLLATALPHARGDIINVGTGRGTSVNQVAKILIEEAGTRSNDVARTKSRPGEIRDSWASISKARRLLGYSAKIRISEGVRHFYRWYRAAPEKE